MTDKAQGAAAILTWQERLASAPERYVDSERRAMVAEIADLRAALKAQPAPTEAQGGKMLELFKYTLGSLALHDLAEAERIGKMYRADGTVIDYGTPILAQGEDSARLDAVPMWEYYGCTEAEWGEFKAWSKNRARASAETGGVKS